jgi:imidazolonepropionase-like amidohydrolase
MTHRELAAFGVLALAACAGRSQPPLPEARSHIAIQDVTVVDVVTGQLRPHTTVVLAGTRIVAVGPTDSTPAPPGSDLIDGRGRYLIPGLWDMHTHSLWSEEALSTFLPLYVAEGVTGIRDMGGRLDILAAARDSLRRGHAPFPRLIAAGMILDGPEPVNADISIGVADAACARAAVDSLGRAGVDFIKVYTLLPREAYFAALAEARRLGLPVAGHVPASVTPEAAARAGQRSIEHLREEIEPFCSPKAPEACAQLAAVFRLERTWQVPTLGVLRMKGFIDDSAITTDPRLAYVPTGLRREWLAERKAKIGRGASYLAGKRQRYADELWLTELLSREGVGLLAGTDAGVAFSYPGFSLHDELALLVEAGLSPLAALRSATLAPAMFLGARDSMGAVAAGQVADLVLLTADPLADIRATREIDAVVLRGRVLARRDLDELLASTQTRVAQELSMTGEPGE